MNTLQDRINYSAALTGEPFLYYEIRQVAKLKVSGLNEQQIRQAVRDNNLFQYSTEKSLTKRLTAVLRRIETLDESLLQFLAEKPSASAKVVNLYAIAKTNRLVRDFIIEVIGEKFENDNLHLEKKDINEFFIAKREQNENVAQWSDTTVAKLKQVLTRIIFEVGILADQKTGRLKRPVLDADIVKCLKNHGETELLGSMGINT
ncbi:MAG: DUF1819 family protein [Eubacteriales bacterium]|nr:DUF1819 family protein [Eubacteriales bacterium]